MHRPFKRFTSGTQIWPSDYTEMFIQPEDAGTIAHVNTGAFQAWFNRQINRQRYLHTVCKHLLLVNLTRSLVANKEFLSHVCQTPISPLNYCHRFLNTTNTSLTPGQPTLSQAEAISEVEERRPEHKCKHVQTSTTVQGFCEASLFCYTKINFNLHIFKWLLLLHALPSYFRSHSHS